MPPPSTHAAACLGRRRSGAPPEIVEQVSQALAEVLKDEAIMTALQAFGAEPIGSSPA